MRDVSQGRFGTWRTTRPWHRPSRSAWTHDLLLKKCPPLVVGPARRAGPARRGGPELLRLFSGLLLAALATSGPVVFPLELLDAAGGIDVLHLAGEERMARRADFDRDVFLGAARGELVTAAARDGRFFVLRMDFVLHKRTPYLENFASLYCKTPSRHDKCNRRLRPCTVSEPLPPTPSPKRRGGAEGEQPERAPPPCNGAAAVFLPLSASGRGSGGGVGR